MLDAFSVYGSAVAYAAAGKSHKKTSEELESELAMWKHQAGRGESALLSLSFLLSDACKNRAVLEEQVRIGSLREGALAGAFAKSSARALGLEQKVLDLEQKVLGLEQKVRDLEMQIAKAQESAP
jgi:chromosome segregation ATPase